MLLGFMRLSSLLSAATSLVAMATGCAKQPVLGPGDMAPAFSLIGSDGKSYDSAALRGKYVVVAWFPKAFTGG